MKISPLLLLALASLSAIPAWAQPGRRAPNAEEEEEEEEEPKPPPIPPLPPPAPKDPGPEALAKARDLFEAGARSYELGQYRVAIQAFEAANRLVDRPGLGFSIAQAHRRQYFVDRRPGHVAIAIQYYERYLSEVDSGGKRAEAVTALEQLKPIESRLEASGELVPLPEMVVETRLVVSSPTPGVMASLDGAPPQPVPLVLEATPGSHTVTFTANGYATQERQVEVPKGGVTSLDITLTEQPGALAVTGPAGAAVLVDDDEAGRLPLAQPLPITPGAHLVRVSLDGHVDHVEPIRVDRGEQASIDAELGWTRQREASIGLMATGGVLVLGGVALGSVALARQAEASSLKSDFDAGAVTCRGAVCEPFDDYQSAVDDRTAFGTGSLVLLGVGAATAAAGVVLYFFDDGAEVGPPPLLPDDDEPDAPAPTERPTLELGLAPAVGPTGGFLSVQGRF